MSRKKIIYIDMDDTIADFYGSAGCPLTGKVNEYKMWNKDFFFNLKPLPGSQGAIFDLIKMGFDVWILSQPLADSHDSYTDKAKWIQLHFPQLNKKIILTQDKSLHVGEYLVDDNEKKWKEPFEKNGGKFIHFKYGGYNGNRNSWYSPETQWRMIVDFFSKESPII